MLCVHQSRTLGGCPGTANMMNVDGVEMIKPVTPHRCGLVGQKQEIDGLQDITRTFKEVYHNAVRYALALRKFGIGEGTYVAFLTHTTIDAYEFTVGVWLAGGCVCPMNPSLRPGEIAQLLETSTACFVYCDHSEIAVLEEAKGTLTKGLTIFTNTEREDSISLSSLLTDDSAVSVDTSLFSPTPYDPHDHITYVLFTSGTTGVSKGVMLSSYATLLAGSRIYESKGPTLVTTPFYWVSNPATFVHSVLSGSEMIFPRTKRQPKTNAVDQHHIPRCIEKYKPRKWMTAPSTILDICYIPGIGDYDLSSLTHLSVGGSAILPKQKKFICETLFQNNILQERYGSTETGFCTREWSFPPPDFDNPKAASFGPPCPGVELKVVDMETGNELGPNQVGELFVRSSAMMNGYINKDMPERYTKEDWYDIGDMGYYDEDGWIYFKARSKEILKYRGYHMAPADLEKVILQHPDVLDACVVGAPHPIDGEWPTAFVVKKENSSLSESELQLFFDSQVSEDKKLRGGVFFKDSLPQSSVGKLLRRKLVEEAKLILMNKNELYLRA